MARQNHDLMNGLMPSATPTALYGPNDFDLIEAAVKETERGRWFLEEFARRNRHADTIRVLDAVARLEGAALRPDGRSARLIEELSGVGQVLSELSGAPADPADGIALQDSRVAATAGEALLGAADHLRTREASAKEHAILDTAAQALFAASARLEHAARREALTGETLRTLADRIGGVVSRFAAPDVPALPATVAAPASQDEAPLSVAPAPPATAPMPEPALVRPRVVAPPPSPFADIDHLSPADRLRFFH